MSDLVCGIGTVVTTFTVTNSASGDIGTSVLVSIISAIIFAILNVLTKIITSYLEKKGLISHEHKKAIDDTADDLADDGQINGSAKSKVDEKDVDDVK